MQRINALTLLLGAALLVSALGATSGVGAVMPSPAGQTSSSTVAIALAPGWNLISLPFKPVDAGINAVFPPAHPVDAVITLDRSLEAWLVSLRDPETKAFSGDILEMTASRAYFIHTDSSLPLLVVPPSGNTPTLPPTALPRKVGWHLVPVVAPSYLVPHAVAADDHLGELLARTNQANWLKALSYDTRLEQWEGVSPGAVIQASVGDVNQCTGLPLDRLRVETGIEPCQNGAYTELSPVGSTTVDNAWGKFDGQDQVLLKAALRMGKGYWVFVNIHEGDLP